MASFVRDLEEIIEIVSDWGLDIINTVVDKLTEGGPPFDTIELTPAEQMEEYMKFRGNPQAWLQELNKRAEALTQKLSESGLDQSTIESIHPYNAAFLLLASHSYEMETKLQTIESKRKGVKLSDLSVGPQTNSYSTYPI